MQEGITYMNFLIKIQNDDYEFEREGKCVAYGYWPNMLPVKTMGF